MNRLVTTDTQPASYAERRAAMADETRVRILDACVAILARGVAELSIPAVAREAGVSVPTVYRNFADKKTLVAETALHLRAKRGPLGYPATLEELPAQLREQYERAASMSETVAAALQSEPILAARRDLGMQAIRLADTDRLLADHMRDATPEDRANAVMLVAMLCSSGALRTFKDVTGASPARAAEVVSWAISRIVGRPTPAPKKAPRKKASKR
jgi:AcrR family transcriptional regulator